MQVGGWQVGSPDGLMQLTPQVNPKPRQSPPLPQAKSLWPGVTHPKVEQYVSPLDWHTQDGVPVAALGAHVELTQALANVVGSKQAPQLSWSLARLAQKALELVGLGQAVSFFEQLSLHWPLEQTWPDGQM
jgi:hypothetical protein